MFVSHVEFLAFTNSRIGKQFSTGFLSSSLCEIVEKKGQAVSILVSVKLSLCKDRSYVIVSVMRVRAWDREGGW